jgi:hypothetical protein
MCLARREKYVRCSREKYLRCCSREKYLQCCSREQYLRCCSRERYLRCCSRERTYGLVKCVSFKGLCLTFLLETPQSFVCFPFLLEPPVPTRQPLRPPPRRLRRRARFVHRSPRHCRAIRTPPFPVSPPPASSPPWSPRTRRTRRPARLRLVREKGQGTSRRAWVYFVTYIRDWVVP